MCKILSGLVVPIPTRCELSICRATLLTLSVAVCNCKKLSAFAVDDWSASLPKTIFPFLRLEVLLTISFVSSVLPPPASFCIIMLATPPSFVLINAAIVACVGSPFAPTTKGIVGLPVPIPTLFSEASTNSVLESKFTSPLAVSVVNAPVLADSLPMAVPSISPLDA